MALALVRAHCVEQARQSVSPVRMAQVYLCAMGEGAEREAVVLP